MREKNDLVAEQDAIRVKARGRTGEYRSLQQAIAALKSARESDAARQNGPGTISAPPHGLPTVTNTSSTAMAATSSGVRPTKEVEIIIIESDEDEGGDGDENLIAGPASRQLFKPVDAIHEQFPFVVALDGQWHEIRCRGCSANIKPGTSTRFKGLRGLRVHYRQCHCPRGNLAPTAEVCCIMRPVSATDAALMKQGLPPRDVAVEASYAPKMLIESRRETSQASNGVGQSEKQIERSLTRQRGCRAFMIIGLAMTSSNKISPVQYRSGAWLGAGQRKGVWFEAGEASGAKAIAAQAAGLNHVVHL
ncbi:hypothetical protein AC579_4624 [Pseudocercospora musae]|uniref:Uncharacterized protein n=1 Tax=Pseudocercospora musae TaxID=113226 RepID=A0A139HK72_9PEZI|nr:hypothetical protein AC579_4624 [Pseudocercospora musae]